MRGLWPMSKRGRGGGQKHTKFVKQRNITKITEYYRITEYYNGTKKTKRKSPHHEGCSGQLASEEREERNTQTKKQKKQTNQRNRQTNKQKEHRNKQILQ